MQWCCFSYTAGYGVGEVKKVITDVLEVHVLDPPHVEIYLNPEAVSFVINTFKQVLYINSWKHLDLDKYSLILQSLSITIWTLATSLRHSFLTSSII